MTICPKCGEEFSLESNYCPFCDSKLTNKTRKFYSDTTLDLSNLEGIPLKTYLLPKLMGLGAITTACLVFVCII